ncbi:MAG: cobaltochelatase subunit CobT, partial [Rhizobiales bacterium]|nr:cobaltochelatase subunit CobT [Hyphomicrobiales bacterium]
MAGRGDNLKGKTGGPVDVEPLRRAITGCVRSIAGDSEVEVSFSNDRPGLAGERVRLPEISKRPTAQELAVTRGLGDSMALRIACHDTNVHASLSPQGADARSVFDAVEQARVESIGALRMTGMASNIESMNAEKYAKANFSGIERQEDAPLAEAMAMMVREKLAGTRTPASAGKVLDLWRPFIEEKAGPALDNLKGALEDQQAFAKLVRNMLSSMQMAEDLGDDEAEPEELDNPNDEEQPRSNEAENEEVEEEAGSDAAPAEQSEAADDELDEGEMDGAEMSDDEMSDEADDHSETPGETRRPHSPFD